MCGLDRLELGRTLPQNLQPQGVWEHWQQPQSRKQGCCFTRKHCQTFPILEKATDSNETLFAQSSPQTWTHSVLGSKCDRACRVVLPFLPPGFQRQNVLQIHCLILLKWDQFFLHFSFITPAIASKKVQIVLSKFSLRFLCLCHKSPIHHCIPQAYSLFTSLTGRKGGDRMFAEYVLIGGELAEYLNTHW